MSKTPNLQDAFLASARRDETPVTVFLMNGFQMRGVITGFDAFTVVLMTDGRQNLIYKHAISPAGRGPERVGRGRIVPPPYHPAVKGVFP